MPYAIITGTLIQQRNSSWYEGQPCNPVQLTAELEALAIPGIGTYSCFGSPGERQTVQWALRGPGGKNSEGGQNDGCDTGDHHHEVCR